MRYEARCREKEAKQSGSAQVVGIVETDEAINKSVGYSREVLSAETGVDQGVGAESMVAENQRDETFFLSFAAPTMESTRAEDQTLTEVETSLSETPKVNFAHSAIQGRGCEQLLKSESSGSEIPLFPDEGDSRRVLIEGGFAMCQGNPYQPLSADRTQPRGKFAVSLRTALWIVAGVVAVACIVGVVALSDARVSEVEVSTEAPIVSSSTMSPAEFGSTTPMPPFVPDGGRIDVRTRFELSLHGFSCGFLDAGGNELCVSLDRGICVRLKGKRRQKKMNISVVVDVSKPLRVCRDRRNFHEV